MNKPKAEWLAWWLQLAKGILLVAATISVGAAIYFAHAYRCRTLDGRSDVILEGRMVEVCGDRKYVMIDVIELYKGAIRGGQQRILVDIVPRWGGGLDIMPPWPTFQTNRIAGFFLRKSFWSSSYEPIFITETPRHYRTNEPCAIEMNLVSDREHDLISGDSDRARLSYKPLWRVADEWDKNRGTTASNATELLQYVAKLSTGVCTKIEIRWSDENRGVVSQVNENPNGSGEVTWYLFKYENEWHELLRRSRVFN